jgi:outer membrane protein TolC
MSTAWLLSLAVGASLFAQVPGTALVVSAPAQGRPTPVHLLDGPRQYDGPPLTLASALVEASARNPDILADRQQVDVARQRPAQARSLAPPMVETEIWQWPINTLNPANTNMYMFMATQELPGRGKRDLRAAVASRDIDLAEADVAVRTREIVSAVKQAYAALCLSRKAIDIHIETADLLRQFADVSQAKYATGATSQQDVLKSVVELSKLHEDIILFEQRAQVATMRLNTLMGRPIDTPIGPLTDPDERTLVSSVAQLEDAAIAHRPELRVAHEEVERADAALALAKQDVKPDFSIQGGYLLMPHQTDGWLARVGVTWPNAPWARGKLDAHIKEMAAAVEAAQARERALGSATRLALREAYIAVKAAEQRAALLRTTIIPQSQQTLEVSRLAYQTDRSDFLAMLDNERLLLDAHLEYARTLGAFDQAIADLERTLGTDLPPEMFAVVARTNGGDR